MHYSILWWFLLFLFRSGISKFAPDYIKPCPGLKQECLKTSAQAAIPELVKGISSLGIDTLDPLTHELKLELPGGVKIEFWNGTVSGLRGCVVDSIKYKNNEADMKLHCDLTIEGLYKATGRILLFTLNGDGEVNIVSPNIILNCKIRFEDKKRNGIVYHDIRDYRITHKYGDRVIFDITNLLKGSPTLSEIILTFLNENWKAVADEFGNPIVNEVVQEVFKHLKKFFSGIPKEELFVS